MKTIDFTFLLILFIPSLFAQNKITIMGDENDPAIKEEKAKIEARGFKVEVAKAHPIAIQYEGKPFTAFELNDLSGNRVSHRDFIGKKVHLNFWSTACKPCIDEFPEMNALKAKYEKQGFKFLSMVPESVKKVQRLLSKKTLEYQILPNAAAYLKDLGINTYPISFFIDEKGIIQKVIVGRMYRPEQPNGIGKPKLISDNYRAYERALLAL